MISKATADRTSTRSRVEVISFVSRTGDVGRTSIVANVAWIMASAGRRVLVLDWGSEAPWVRQYLPFDVDILSADQALGGLGAALNSVAGADDRRHRLIVNRHAPPDAEGSIDLVGYAAAGTGRGAPVEPATLDGRIRPERLRRLLRSSDYDYVLIDFPTGTSMAALVQVSQLSDTVAVCFPSRAQAIADAADTVRLLAESTAVGLRVLAVATRVELRDTYGTQHIRGAIRDAFTGAFGESTHGGAGELDGNVVEVPYQPFDAFGQLLAVMFDSPGSDLHLLPAYERLASAVTRGEVSAMPPLAEEIRARYRRVLGLSSGPAERVYLAYGAKDRAWADWIGGQLRRAGADVRRLPEGDEWGTESPDPMVIVIGAEHLAGSKAAERVRRAVGAGGATDRVVFIRIAEEVPGYWTAFRQIDLRGCVELQGRGRLLTGLRMVQPSRPDGDVTFNVRFPAAAVDPTPSNVPPRNPAFVGRAIDVELTRDHLLASDGIRPVLLSGDSGVGKSEIAREYAHRFARDYSFTWWVPGQDRQSISASLAQLADVLGLDSAGDAVAAVLAGLASHPTPWLIIYDGVEHDDVLEGLLPTAGHGHVLITSRRPSAGHATSRVVVDRLSPEDSLALLRGYVPSVTEEDAQSLADAGERLPLTMRLIGAWMREAVRTLHRQAANSPSAAVAAAAELLSRMDVGRDDGATPSALARVWRASARTLGETSSGRLAVMLAELCAFLSPDGIGLRLLRSAPMMHQLLLVAGDEGREINADAAEFDRVVWTGARFGLLDVDWGDGASVRMHHALQAVLRDGMTAEQRRDRQRKVLDGLATYAPTDAEEEGVERRAKLDELQKHLASSGALEDDAREVRRWVVSQFRHFYREGSPHTWPSAAALATKVLERWDNVVKPDDDLRLRLTVELANLWRALGDQQRAYELDLEAQTRQQRLLGERHLRTLITTRGWAGDLRGLGEFDEAQLQDHIVVEGLREALGDDHPNTLMATHNLALSSYLRGDVRVALALEQGVLARRRRLSGTGPYTAWAATTVGIFLRELGRYEEAESIFRNALGWIRSHHPATTFEEMRIKRCLAVSRRRNNDPGGAKQEHVEVLRAFRQLLGEDHPETWACRLGLAADYHWLDEPEAAVAEADPCLSYYSEVMGEDHPFTSLCRVNLSTFMRGTGALESAVELSESACRGLEDRLGEGHPWVLAAEIVHANALASNRRREEADRLAAKTLADCHELLGADHPYTAAAVRNRDADPHVRQDIEIDVPRT